MSAVELIPTVCRDQALSVADFVLKIVPFLAFVRLKIVPFVLKIVRFLSVVRLKIVPFFY